jgi:hypothetical protein
VTHDKLHWVRVKRRNSEIFLKFPNKSGDGALTDQHPQTETYCMSAIATSRARQRYDAFTLTLHWLTAASVIFLLVSSACLIFRAGLPSIPRCAV